jgi:lysophospholipase L1-like esterase
LVVAALAVVSFGCAGAPPRSGPTWVVGDSYTVGIQSSGQIDGTYRSKVGATIDNRVPFLEEAAAKHPGVLYVVAGINNAPNSGESSYLLRKVRLGMDATKGAACVVWATYPERLSGSYAYLSSRVATLNSHIRAEARSRSNVVVADFAPVVAANPSLMAGDGLHLDPDGYRRLASVMAEAQNQCG